MKRKLKAIIFDWGRTLYDPEKQALFPCAEEALAELAGRYILAIVSLATDGDFARRYAILKATNLERYFDVIQFAQKDKDSLYEQTISQLGLKPDEVAIVDDRVIRGIRWGNQHGALTIWMRNGKFKDEMPDEQTGQPDYIITDIEELLAFMDQ
jgi:FMN phosphatase YigB (HAD superfamily)